MKNIILLLAATLVLTLTSCGGGMRNFNKQKFTNLKKISTTTEETVGIELTENEELAEEMNPDESPISEAIGTEQDLNQLPQEELEVETNEMTLSSSSDDYWAPLNEQSHTSSRTDETELMEMPETITRDEGERSAASIGLIGIGAILALLGLTLLIVLALLGVTFGSPIGSVLLILPIIVMGLGLILLLAGVATK